MAGLSTKYNYDAYLQHRNEQNQNQQNQGQNDTNTQQSVVMKPMVPDNNTNVAKDDAGMRGMMKSTIATASHYGNPTARRMTGMDGRDITIPNQYEYDKGVGEQVKGNVLVSSYDNMVTPHIQDKGGSLEQVQKPWSEENKERSRSQSLKFNNEKDARYFGEHYKEVAPMMNTYGKKEDIDSTPQPQEENRKHGWRDWFKKTNDEEYENRKRERIAAFSDMIRHLANLHYVNQYATPQHIESAYGKVKAEEKEQRKLRREQEKEDRKWNWKVSEAQRDQANKDRTYGLGVRKDKRAEELQPYKKAEADKKAKRAEYLAQKAAADAEWAPKINDAKEKRERAKASLDLEKGKTERSKQAANNALAAQRRAKAANERDSKLVHFPTNDVNYLWAVNKNDVKVIQTKLRSFAKGRKWAKGYVDEFGNLKKGATDSDLLNAAMGNAHDPEVQRFLNTYGKRVRSEYNEEQDYQLK